MVWLGGLIVFSRGKIAHDWDVGERPADASRVNGFARMMIDIMLGFTEGLGFTWDGWSETDRLVHLDEY